MLAGILRGCLQTASPNKHAELLCFLPEGEARPPHPDAAAWRQVPTTPLPPHTHYGEPVFPTHSHSRASHAVLVAHAHDLGSQLSAFATVGNASIPSICLVINTVRLY